MAGWSNATRITILGSGFQSLRWSNLRTLWAARNEKIADRLPNDPAAAMRSAWLCELDPDGSMSRRDRVQTPLAVAASRGEPHRVLLVGDTGDGSEAQRAVAQHLAGRAGMPGSALQSAGVDAVLIESDLIYPAGSANEYRGKFDHVYRELFDAGLPIYAVPGNHDWDDGSLSGFMATFCGATVRPGSVDEVRRQSAGGGRRSRLARWPMWHDGSKGPLPEPSNARAQPHQPAPYVALDIGGVLFVGVDTGYGDTVDREQAEWLVAVVEAHSTSPKLMFSGKPLIVNGHRAPCYFTGGDGDHSVVGSSGVTYTSVDDVVRRRENGFVAAIGGDVHNYQRYLAHIKRNGEAERMLPYLVCGGGGVFVSQTAWLDLICIGEEASDDHVSCGEKETVLFPPRAHSRLYLDAIIRQARRRVRFTLPIALVSAGLLALVLWVVLRVALLVADLLGHELWFSHVPGPNPAAAGALMLAALAVNMSARPIRFRGRFAVFVIAVAGAGLGWLSVRHGVTAHGSTLGGEDTRLAIVATFGVGQLLMQVGELAVLSSTRARRWVGTAISAVAGLLLAGGSALAFDAASRQSVVAHMVLVVLGLLGIATAAATWLVVRRVSVDEAFDDASAVLEGDPRPDRLRRDAVTNWLAKNQRRFSIYETFTDGRLTQKTRLNGLRERCYLPLYRSLLEIEFRRDAATPERWEFAFTAHAVTGEATVDTQQIGTGGAEPVIVDAFRARWQPGELEIDTS